MICGRKLVGGYFPVFQDHWLQDLLFNQWVIQLQDTLGGLFPCIPGMASPWLQDFLHEDPSKLGYPCHLWWLIQKPIKKLDLQCPLDHHFMILPRENFRASFEKFSCFPEQSFQLPQSQEKQLEDFQVLCNPLTVAWLYIGPTLVVRVNQLVSQSIAIPAHFGAPSYLKVDSH